MSDKTNIEVIIIIIITKKTVPGNQVNKHVYTGSPHLATVLFVGIYIGSYTLTTVTVLVLPSMRGLVS